MNEIPDDEGDIIDPFDSDLSDIDESNEIEDDNPQNNRNFEQNLFNSMIHTVWSLKSRSIFTKYKRLFRENQTHDWHRFENSPDFADKKFDRSKISTSIGYRRDGITEEMLNDPFKLHEFIYGASRSGRSLANYFIYNVICII